MSGSSSLQVLQRLREPSTWAGLAGLAALFNLPVATDVFAAVSQTGMAAASLAAILLTERGR
ncbi:MAG: hypothetical protein EAZ99_16620 [Alphaproteobacteria bacterium]|nr:hypothetical protein [Alphaproteobacteria bacterium]TAD87703.1 MAG: hypothetical protein EAZ99_16620 [Alphaproteobacteria bacterium]